MTHAINGAIMALNAHGCPFVSPSRQITIAVRAAPGSGSVEPEGHFGEAIGKVGGQLAGVAQRDAVLGHKAAQKAAVGPAGQVVPGGDRAVGPGVVDEAGRFAKAARSGPAAREAPRGLNTERLRPAWPRPRGRAVRQAGGWRPARTVL